MKGSSSYVPQRLRNLMDKNGVGVIQLAEATSVSQQTIMNYLRYESSVGLSSLINIADYFSVPIDYFLDRIDDEAAEKILDGSTKEFSLRRKVAYEKYLNSGRKAWVLHDKCQESPWPYNMIEAMFQERCTEVYPDHVIDSIEEHLLSPTIRMHEKTKYMLLDYYKNLMTLDQIAAKYDLTRERIRQRIKKGLRIMRHPAFSSFILRDDEKIRKEIDELNKQADRIKEDIRQLEKEKEYCELLIGDAKEKIEINVSDSVNELSINELDLSVRSFNCLNRAGYHTLFDVIACARDGKLTQIRNLGRHSEREILEMIKLKTGIDYTNKKGGVIHV